MRVLYLPTGLSKILSFSSFSHMCDCIVPCQCDECVSFSLCVCKSGSFAVVGLSRSFSFLFACKNQCVQIDRRQFA